MARPTRITCRSAALAAVLLSATLVACGDKDSPSPPMEQSNSDPSESVSSNSTTGPDVLQSESTAPPAQSAPQPPQEYTPNEHEVRHAFRGILLSSYHTRPEGPERDQWFVTESNRILGIQVGNCTPAPLGMVSECYVSISGQAMKVQLLLTQSGWVIIG